MSLHGTTCTKPVFYAERRRNAKILLDFHRFYFQECKKTQQDFDKAAYFMA